VDASVAAKWCLPARDEPLVEEALVLLRGYIKGEIRLLVPDLFWAELANLLWKAVRLGRCASTAAQTALTGLQERKLPTVSSLGLVDLAFGIATAFDRTVYDSLYVALALDSKAQLITADERLANALAAHLPVKYLGAA
jgi:predicted nucleic acid-binding protein